MGQTKHFRAEVISKRIFGDASPSEAADEELRWFFNDAEVAIAEPSNFYMTLGGMSASTLEMVEARAEAMHAAAKIKARLEAISATQAVLLAGLFTERVWPKGGRREVVAACAEAIVAYERARGTGASVVPQENV